MSKYTTELRFICEQLAGLQGSVDYDKIDRVIDLSRGKIFDFDYPIFDGGYRNGLEKKIILHYYTREICAETYARWKLFLRSRMIEMMPYYNKLYEAELLMRDVNIFDDTDYTVDYKGDGKRDGKKIGNNKDTNSGKDNVYATDEPHRDTWELFSDTPQGDIIAMESDEHRYLTNATHTIQSGVGSVYDADTTYGRVTDYSINETNNTDIINNYLKRVKGKVNPRSYAKLFKELSESFLNIDALVVDNLKDLFYNLW